MQVSDSVRCTPDGGEESYLPVRDGLQLIDQHLHVPSQVLAILHPYDGELRPDLGDVDGAVQFGLVALRQLDGAYGGLEVQLCELLQAHIDLRDAARYLERLGVPHGTVESPPGMLSSL